MGSALTQSHMQNHGDLLAGAILCGTMGAMPGLDDAQYESVIQELRALRTGADARVPRHLFGKLLTGFSAPFAESVPALTGSEWQTSDAEEIRRS